MGKLEGAKPLRAVLPLPAGRGRGDRPPECGTDEDLAALLDD